MLARARLVCLTCFSQQRTTIRAEQRVRPARTAALLAAARDCGRSCRPLAGQRPCGSSQPATARLVARQWKAQAGAPSLGGRKGGRGKGGARKKAVAQGKARPAWGPGPGGAMTVGALLEAGFPPPTAPTFSGSILGAAPRSELEAPQEGGGDAGSCTSCEDQ